MSSLLTAMRPLAWDFTPTITFAILIALHVDVRIATAAALGVGVLQVLGMVALRRPVPLLQWAGLVLAIAFGAISILTKDPRYVMAKPTLIYIVVGVVMLKRGWLTRYMPERVLVHGRDEVIGWGYAWAGLMFATAVANLVVALRFQQFWPVFMAVVPMWSKMAFFATQYVSMRLVIGPRVRSAMLDQAAQAA